MEVRKVFFRLVVGSAPERKPWSRFRRPLFLAATERRQGEFQEMPERRQGDFREQQQTRFRDKDAGRQTRRETLLEAGPSERQGECEGQGQCEGGGELGQGGRCSDVGKQRGPERVRNR